jgi:hypothetical protein
VILSAEGVLMIMIIGVGTAWLVSGYSGAVLLDMRAAGPLKFLDVVMGPVSLALGIMVATERRG